MHNWENESLRKSLAGCHLDHVAIAVNDLDAACKTYQDIGVSFEEKREVVESQGVTTAFGAIDYWAKIELLEPFGEEGPLHKFLEKRGPGIHHICFCVADVKKKCEELKKLGYQLLNPEPVKGAHNCLVNFIHPKSTGGVLIELSQPTGNPY